MSEQTAYPEEIKTQAIEHALHRFKLTCPNCKGERTRVADSRGCRDRNAIKRIRECTDCNYLFHTYEVLEDQLSN